MTGEITKIGDKVIIDGVSWVAAVKRGKCFELWNPIGQRMAYRAVWQ